MVHTPRGRDTVRLAVASVTALAGAASLTAVGWLAGAAARQHHAQQAREYDAQAKAMAAAAVAKAKYDQSIAAWRLQQERPRVVLRNRPTRTVTRTTYQRGVPVTVGGGTFSAAPPSAPSGQAPAPAPHGAPPPAPAPAPPPPAPAPSSGS
jgi:hypothetical protein